jgi:hypothetical protein
MAKPFIRADSGQSRLVSRRTGGYHPGMPLQQLGLTPLEIAVIGAIYEKYPEDRATLESQFSVAIFRSRENTGAGFYTNFEVERASGVAIGGERLRHGPQAAIDGLNYGMGFILWLSEGYLSSLEGYSYEESTVGIDLSNVTFEILKN